VERRTGHFTAYDEEKNAHVIYEYTDFIAAGSHDDPNARVPGLRTLRTSDGAPVNYISKGEYRVVATGKILRSHESTAP
jgi:hypothetical protein